jgi:uncharacterized protein DUF6766
MSIWKRYSYAWVTAGFFLFSLAGHWLFGWYAYADEQLAHGQPVEMSSYLTLMARDTLENWQSEFLQLLWQVGGLAFLLFVGSPQSKEEGNRTEDKIDMILRKLDPAEAEKVIAELDRKYPGRQSASDSEDRAAR